MPKACDHCVPLAVSAQQVLTKQRNDVHAIGDGDDHDDKRCNNGNAIEAKAAVGEKAEGAEDCRKGVGQYANAESNRAEAVANHKHAEKDHEGHQFG